MNDSRAVPGEQPAPSDVAALLDPHGDDPYSTVEPVTLPGIADLHQERGEHRSAASIRRAAELLTRPGAAPSPDEDTWLSDARSIINQACNQDDSDDEHVDWVTDLLAELVKLGRPSLDEDTRREVEAPEQTCRGFQWIGQSFEHCDGCGRPSWDHDFEERIDRKSGPFSGKWLQVPWPADLVGRWLDRGLIDATRGAEMLTRAAAYLGRTEHG